MTLWRVRLACWTTKATITHSEYVVVIAFPRENVCTKVPQCYVIRTLPLP